MADTVRAAPPLHRAPSLAFDLFAYANKFLQEAPQKRKSVAFSDGATIVDSDGQVTETATNGHDETAQSHAPAGDKEVDEMTEMFKSMPKKKKKSSSKDKEESAAAADGEFDPSAIKK